MKSIRGGASSAFAGPLRVGRDARTPPAETGDAHHLCGRPAARRARELAKKNQKTQTQDEYLKGSFGSLKQVTAEGLDGFCALVPRRASPVKRSRPHDSRIK